MVAADDIIAPHQNLGASRESGETVMVVASNASFTLATLAGAISKFNMFDVQTEDDGKENGCTQITDATEEDMLEGGN